MEPVRGWYSRPNAGSLAGNESPGKVCSEPVIGYDLFPTWAEVAGQPVDLARFRLDGCSLVPLFEESGTPLNRQLIWHFPYYHPEGGKFSRALPTIGVNDFAVSQTRPHSAIRMNNYKANLICRGPTC